MEKRYWPLYDVLKMIAILGESLKQAQAEQTRLEQAKREWLSGVAHDLKTPLTYVKGYAAMLLQADENWNEEEKHNGLREIYTQSEFLENLIYDLNLSFQQGGKAEGIPLQIELVEMVSYVREIVIDAANHPNAQHNEWEYTSNQDTIFTELDPKLFRRALQNLLINAVTHNPLTTRISVELAAAHQISLAIKDNGGGMPGTYSEAASGSHGGLGITIARSIVSAHGGALYIDSVKGIGTTIRITVPIHKQ